ncbi:MAG: gfo/Idh/MocA family oxidoreductase, partial [Pseudomonadota bacterium]
QGTDGQIELRKYTDVGRPHVTDTLYLVNGEENTRLDCANAGLPYFARLIADVQDRTETAMAQAHAFTTMELAIRAQIQAEA